MTIRICIADRQPRVRYGLRILLEQQPGWKVNGEATNAQELLEQVVGNPPDLILLDWELPGIKDEDLLSRLSDFCPDLMIISISAHHEAQQAALDAGVDGFASKTQPPEKLISLIHKIIRVRPKIETTENR